MSQSSSILDSYPPLFRQNSHESSPQNPTNDDQEEDPLPVIDLELIDLEKLHEACRDWGVFRLVNHGISSTFFAQVGQHAGEVFGLGFDVKQALFDSIPSSIMSYFWGTPALTPAGVALHNGTKEQVLKFNWVEGLNVPLGQPLEFQQLDQHHPLLRSFRNLLEEYGKHQARIARLVFEAMTKNLNLCSEEETENYVSPSTGFLRVYRYPRGFKVNQQKVWGMEVHTDSSVVTILNQFEVGGLQILNEKDDVWIDVKPIPNTLVVHLGDMMQAMSDDKYKSVKHRVKVQEQNERISVGYFVFPRNDHVIRAASYQPFTYLDFRAQVQQDVKTLGVKLGLPRFKVNKAS